ncbi:MAG TPA: hypothetical protein VG672_09670 [Bryobacteraceae bacterium]|nr:hypothetical protein [Bryobacteraceae bacterium]
MKPKRSRKRSASPPRFGLAASAAPYLAFAIVAIIYAIVQVHAHYTFSLRSPIRLQWPVVVAARMRTEDASEAQADQFGRPLTAYQQYACKKFGTACRLALAIQRAENPRGVCEIYHYNTDGTLDWGYFQINTVHLQRPGLNLRDLLDCKANIDFAYQLYQERGFQPWSTYKNGAYLKFLRER